MCSGKRSRDRVQLMLSYQALLSSNWIFSRVQGMEGSESHVRLWISQPLREVALWMKVVFLECIFWWETMRGTSFPIVKSMVGPRRWGSEMEHYRTNPWFACYTHSTTGLSTLFKPLCVIYKSSPLQPTTFILLSSRSGDGSSLWNYRLNFQTFEGKGLVHYMNN